MAVASETLMRLTFIDRIVELKPGERITAAKCLSLTESYLGDHFPFFPIMPGVLMLEAMYQTAAWLVRVTDDFQHSLVTLAEANNVKYSDFVEPGQTLRVTAELVKQRKPRVSVQVPGRGGGPSGGPRTIGPASGPIVGHGRSASRGRRVYDRIAAAKVRHPLPGGRCGGMRIVGTGRLGPAGMLSLTAPPRSPRRRASVSGERREGRGKSPNGKRDQLELACGPKNLCNRRVAGRNRRTEGRSLSAELPSEELKSVYKPEIL